MVQLRSGSITNIDIMTEKMTADEFALLLIGAYKILDISDMLTMVVAPDNDEFLDKVSAEVHCQLNPLREQLKDMYEEILRLKKTISDQQVMSESMEQHGHRESPRITGVPDIPDIDGTDGAVLSFGQQIKVDPPVQPRDITMSHSICR